MAALGLPNILLPKVAHYPKSAQVAQTNELWLGSGKVIEADGHSIALFNNVEGHILRGGEHLYSPGRVAGYKVG